jgi:uncharacterized protein YecT (DUF1311 family)
MEKKRQKAAYNKLAYSLSLCLNRRWRFFAREAEAWNAVLMKSGRPMRAQVVLEQEQRAWQKEEDSYVETEQGARDMAAEVTATLAEQG